MMRRLLALVPVLVLVPLAAYGATIAKEDFDGGAVGLTGSSVPALDGGAGDYFGVGSRNAWPQGFPSPGVPFSLADDTVIGYSNDGAAFPTDNEGIWGQNSNFDNKWFAISDTREWTADLTVASWDFDITGFVNLGVQIDMGGISSASGGGYAAETDVVFTASIDGGTPVVLFDLDPVTDALYVTRPMDFGNVSGGGPLLRVIGPNFPTKLKAEDGSLATDTYLDKSVPSGPGAGLVDTFQAGVLGSGLSLRITMSARVPFEAMAFDNIVITGDASVPANSSTWGRVKSRYR